MFREFAIWVYMRLVSGFFFLLTLALAGLGLTQGIVATTDAGRGALKTYGLGLVGLKLDSAKNITSAKAEISAAISIIRQAYDSLLNPNAKPLTDEEKALEARRQNMGQNNGLEYLSDSHGSQGALGARHRICKTCAGSDCAKLSEVRDDPVAIEVAEARCARNQMSIKAKAAEAPTNPASWLSAAGISTSST